ANGSRPDVGAALGDNGLHGFTVGMPGALKTGTAHTLHVRFETSATDLTSSPMTVTCTLAPPNYVGFVDQGDCNTLRGWAAGRSRMFTSIKAEIYDGNTLIATVLANGSRPDVGAAIGDNGMHGFSIPTPAALKTSTAHTVHIRFETSATDLTNSPASLTCP